VEIPDSIAESVIREVVAGTEVKNGPDDPFWDCQDWVCDTLTRQEECGFLTAHQRDGSIDEMIYACLEADDEGMHPLQKQGIEENPYIVLS